MGQEVNKKEDILGPKILNHDTFNFSNSPVIHPHAPIDKDRSLIRKITMYTVDSRDRDYSTHPFSSKYVINLEEDIPDVISAELVDAHIPFKSYMINKTNCKFTMEIDKTKYKIELDHGNYNVLQFGEELKKKIEMMDTSILFFVEYNEIKDKFVFFCNKMFSFYLEDKSNTSKMMGFGFKKYDAKLNESSQHTDAPFELMSEFRKNFDEEKYILLKISGFHIHNSINQMVDRTFAIIPEKKENQNINTDLFTPLKFFNPPIARLSKLQISFVDYNGTPVDFQNHDHYFTIKFESFKHTRKYASFLDI